MIRLLCDHPQDDEPRLPCMQTAIYGTSRCLQHQVPYRANPAAKIRGTVALKPLAPLGDEPLIGEGPKPAGWVGCSCCPDLPEEPGELRLVTGELSREEVESFVAAFKDTMETTTPVFVEAPSELPVAPSLGVPRRGWLARAVLWALGGGR